MSVKSFYTSLAVGFALFLSAAFVIQNPYFTITQKDVSAPLPAHFPKPVYTFQNNAPKAKVFVLGRRLFYDPLLSKDHSVSCASCHERIAAFAHIDHRLSHGIYAKIGTRNVPALQNLIWKKQFMWDGGVNHLEVQPLNPITSPIEMDEDLNRVIHKLRVDSVYPLLFQEAFGDTLINSERLLKSLAQFTGLMISADSRYDRFIQGKETFTAKEKEGLKLFRLNCASCHKEPLLSDQRFRNNGLPADSSLNDKGREGITHLASDAYLFMVPGLRNIERTYPYMHDGRFKNLKEVLNHYGNPKQWSPGADPVLLKMKGLTEEEKTALIAFLYTLTDKTFLYDRRFANPFFVY